MEMVFAPRTNPPLERRIILPGTNEINKLLVKKNIPYLITKCHIEKNGHGVTADFKQGLEETCLFTKEDNSNSIQTVCLGHIW